MKKLIISALCLIGCFAVCIQPVYADDSDNVKAGDRIEIDNHDNVYKADVFGDRIDDDENSQPNYAKKVCKDSKKINSWYKCMVKPWHLYIFIYNAWADNHSRYF